MAANKVYESKEYDRLVKRGFLPYSEGHQRMYTIAIEKIRNGTGHNMPAVVFEAGVGIAFGLREMLYAGIIREYTGVEPNGPSFNYITSNLGLRNDTDRTKPLVHLHPDLFSQEYADKYLDVMGMADEAFCIEVIEHVPMHLHLQFLIALRQVTHRLWFSSPDKGKSKEGVRTTKEWTTLLKQAKFNSIVVDQSNWTYLYECR